MTTTDKTQKKSKNPFGDSRVDSPFQHHADLRTVYQNEFSILRSVISDIKEDDNFQSRGVAVIGEPGMGKTHLMMRLANEVLATNRLLFIRQPNNPNFILYHIYSRILDSLVENVPGTPYSQIEHLLAKSFSKIIINTINAKNVKTAKDETIRTLLSADPMDIYKKFGGEGTETKRRNWNYIETKTLEWWSGKYGFGGHAPAIVKGLIRFCSYSDPKKRDLIRRWLSASGLEKSSLAKIGLDEISDSISKEEFSMEAISVFGKLSIEDEPLIVVFDQLEGLKYNETLLFNFGEAVKDIFTYLPNSLIIFNLFPDRWKEWQSQFDSAVIDRISQHRIFLGTPDKKALKAILSHRADAMQIKLSELFTKPEIETIIERPSIRSVLNTASDYFRLKTDGIPLPKKVLSFEEEIRSAISDLKNDITAIKKFLNFSSPTFKEMETYEELTAYLFEQKTKSDLEYDKKTVISDSDDTGKLMTIIDAAKNITGLKSFRMKTGKRTFPEYVLIKNDSIRTMYGFLNYSGNAFTSRIKNFNTLKESHPDIEFVLIRDKRSPAVRSRIAKQEIKKLEETGNGTFMNLSKNDRLVFETVYATTTDIRNRDLDVESDAALKYLKNKFEKTWINTFI